MYEEKVEMENEVVETKAEEAENRQVPSEVRYVYREPESKTPASLIALGIGGALFLGNMITKKVKAAKAKKDEERQKAKDKEFDEMLTKRGIVIPATAEEVKAEVVEETKTEDKKEADKK